MKTLIIAGIETPGKGTVKVVKGTVDGQRVTLRAWANSPLSKHLTEDATVQIETEARVSKFLKDDEGEPVTERWITTCNGDGEKAAQGGSGFKGGGGGFKGNAKSPSESASIILQVVTKCCVEVYNHERQLEFEAAKHEAGDGKLKWEATMDWSLIAAGVKNLAKAIATEMADMTASVKE